MTGVDAEHNTIFSAALGQAMTQSIRDHLGEDVIESRNGLELWAKFVSQYVQVSVAKAAEKKFEAL